MRVGNIQFQFCYKAQSELLNYTKSSMLREEFSPKYRRYVRRVKRPISYFGSHP